MRRSKAPSVLKSSNNSINTINSVILETKDNNQVTSTTNDKTEIVPTFQDKIVFNIVWRDPSNKKHKTWKGDGTLEIQMESHRAVLKDDKGNYLGSMTKFKIEEMTEGHQMMVGGKEIELLERIKDSTEYWAKIRQQVENRNLEKEENNYEKCEAKKPKGTFVFQPTLVLNHMQPVIKRKIPVGRLNTTPPSLVNLEPLILETPEDTELFKFNKHNRPVHEVRVSPKLLAHLRPHQREGVTFMYACLMGFRNPGFNGCILADEMGLGKTLQCLTVAHTMLRQGPFAGERILQRILIVTPSSLVSNWNKEIEKWLQGERMFAFVVDSCGRKQEKLSGFSAQQHMPFIIVSYESLLGHLDEFFAISFDLLICDEGHRLKNTNTKIYKALKTLNIPRCILLSGTPIQNDLQEFYALADFVNPQILGSPNEFHEMYEKPLIQAQNPEASEETKSLAMQRSEQLKKLTDKFLLRRTQELNRQYLPKKKEYICFVRPSELQQHLLQKALEFYETRKEDLVSFI